MVECVSEILSLTKENLDKLDQFSAEDLIQAAKESTKINFDFQNDIDIENCDVDDDTQSLNLLIYEILEMSIPIMLCSIQVAMEGENADLEKKLRELVHSDELMSRMKTLPLYTESLRSLDYILEEHRETTEAIFTEIRENHHAFYGCDILSDDGEDDGHDEEDYFGKKCTLMRQLDDLSVPYLLSSIQNIVEIEKVYRVDENKPLFIPDELTMQINALPSYVGSSIHNYEMEQYRPEVYAIRRELSKHRCRYIKQSKLISNMENIDEKKLSTSQRAACRVSVPYLLSEIHNIVEYELKYRSNPTEPLFISNELMLRIKILPSHDGHSIWDNKLGEYRSLVEDIFCELRECRREYFGWSDKALHGDNDDGQDWYMKNFNSSNLSIKKLYKWKIAYLMKSIQANADLEKKYGHNNKPRFIPNEPMLRINEIEPQDVNSLFGKDLIDFKTKVQVVYGQTEKNYCAHLIMDKLHCELHRQRMALMTRNIEVVHQDGRGYRCRCTIM